MNLDRRNAPVLLQAYEIDLRPDKRMRSGFTGRGLTQAGAIVLDGIPLRTDATLIRHPDRFDDPRGRAMVATLARLLPAPVVEPITAVA